MSLLIKRPPLRSFILSFLFFGVFFLLTVRGETNRNLSKHGCQAPVLIWPVNALITFLIENLQALAHGRSLEMQQETEGQRPPLGARWKHIGKEQLSSHLSSKV